MWRGHKWHFSQLTVKNSGLCRIQRMPGWAAASSSYATLMYHPFASAVWAFFDFETVAYSQQREPSCCFRGDSEVCLCAPGESQITRPLFTCPDTLPHLPVRMRGIKGWAGEDTCTCPTFCTISRPVPPAPTNTQTGRPLLQTVIVMSRCWTRRYRLPSSSFLLIAGRHGRNDFRISKVAAPPAPHIDFPSNLFYAYPGSLWSFTWALIRCHLLYICRGRQLK